MATIAPAESHDTLEGPLNPIVLKPNSELPPESFRSGVHIIPEQHRSPQGTLSDSKETPSVLPGPVSSSAPRLTLEAYARSLKSSPESGADEIITLLATDIFSRYSLLPPDFSKIFEEEKIARSLVDEFVESQIKAAEPSPVTDIVEDIPKEDKEKLRNFLRNYPQDSKHSKGTLANFIRNNFLTGETPYCVSKLLKLLDGSFQEKLAKKLEHYARDRAEHILKTHYLEAQERSQDNIKEIHPEKFDPHALEVFIGYRMLSQVIALDEKGIPQVNSERLHYVLRFLFKRKFPLDEPLFRIVCKWLNTLRTSQHISTIQRETGLNIEQNVADIRKSDSKSIFSANFSYQDFYLQHFAPAIKEIRKKDLLEGERLRPEDDITAHIGLHNEVEINFHGLQRTNLTMPDEFKACFKALLDCSSQKREEDLRNYFNILPHESLEILEDHMGIAADLIQNLTKEYFQEQPASDNEQVRSMPQKCQFISEIIDCRDIVKLIQIMVYPTIFLRNCTKMRQQELIQIYGSQVYKVIQHQAMQFLSFTLAFRKCALFPTVKIMEPQKEAVNDYFDQALNIRDIEDYSFRFRLVEYLTAAGEKHKPPRYGLVKPNDPLFYSKNNEKIEDKENKRILYPADESKNFFEATVDVPIFGNEEEPKKTIKILIYCGENKQKWHCKTPGSITENFIRAEGRQPDFTDLIRGTIIPKDPEDYEILCRYFLTNNMSDGKKRKNNGNKSRGENDVENSDGSSTFKDHERQILSGFVERPVENPLIVKLQKRIKKLELKIAKVESQEEKGDLVAIIDEMKQDIQIEQIKTKDLVRINFEIQLVKHLDDFAKFSLSKYSNTSHERYRQRRVKKIIETILFPELVYANDSESLRKLDFKHVA